MLKPWVSNILETEEKVNFDCDLPYNFSEILDFLGF